LYEHEAFCARALGLLEPTAQPALVRDAATLLDSPVCELLLDQRLMNGVGNYLRAEILYRARVPPFESARCALERARDAANARARGGSELQSRKEPMRDPMREPHTQSVDR
jgi:formamidopyrimidine-DNA glycosylase